VVKKYNPRHSSELFNQVLALEIVLLPNFLVDAKLPVFSRSKEELESGTVQSGSALIPAQILYLYFMFLQSDVGDTSIGNMIIANVMGVMKESFVIQGWNGVLHCVEALAIQIPRSPGTRRFT
jgi:hypothetical protein